MQTSYEFKSRVNINIKQLLYLLTDKCASINILKTFHLLKLLTEIHI